MKPAPAIVRCIICNERFDLLSDANWLEHEGWYPKICPGCKSKGIYYGNVL